MKSHVCLAMSLWAGVLMGQAADIAVVNASFEADDIIPGNFRVFLPTGWTIYDPEGIVDQNNDAVGGIDPAGTTFFDSVPDGQRAAIVYLGGDSGTSQEAGLEQVLTETLQPYMRYTLSVQIGNIASGTGLPPSDVFGFFNLAGFPGYRIELLAGGTVIASDDNSLFGSIPEAQFRETTAEGVVGGAHPAVGSALQIRLINLNLPGTPEEPGIEVDFDDVRLVREAMTAPQLSIVQNENSVILSWEEDSSFAFTAEQADNLLPPISWVSVTNQVQVDGALRTVVLDKPASSIEAYYRLRSVD